MRQRVLLPTSRNFTGAGLAREISFVHPARARGARAEPPSIRRRGQPYDSTTASEEVRGGADQALSTAGIMPSVRASSPHITGAYRRAGERAPAIGVRCPLRLDATTFGLRLQNRFGGIGAEVDAGAGGVCCRARWVP